MDVLGKLAELLEKAGTIVANLADGVEKANASGLRIYDMYKARAARERLMDLRMDILVLLQVQRALVLDPIDAYLETPSDARWEAVQANLDGVLNRVVGVEERLKNERSDFVLDPSFPNLMETITTRPCRNLPAKSDAKER